MNRCYRVPSSGHLPPRHKRICIDVVDLEMSSIWSLHAGTLVLSIALLSTALAALSLIAAKAVPGEAAACRSWGGTMIVSSCCLLCWFLGQGYGEWISFILGNAAAVGFSVGLWRSIGLLLKRPVPAGWLLAQGVIGLSGIAAVQVAGAPRAVAVVAIAMAYLLACVGSIVLIARDADARRTCWGLALIGVFTTWCALAVGARLYILFFGAGADAVRPMASTPVQVLALSAGSVMLVVASVCFMALLAARHRRVSLERARRDGLTGVYTRAAFLQEAARHPFGHEPFTVIMLDLDHFKRINDQHGHLAGDVVLAHAARQIQAQVRGVDLVGRYGGEEFCILLPRCGLDEATLVARRICTAMASHTARLADGRNVSLTASLGVAASSPGERMQALQHILDRADQALYRAKALGRNQVQVAAATPHRQQGATHETHDPHSPGPDLAHAGDGC